MVHEPSSIRFPIRIDPRFALLLRLVFGVAGANSYVDLDPGVAGDLDARFGRFRIRQPVANVERWGIEGPWRSITALGVRMSVRHRDLTFGGTARGGVRIDFLARVPYGPFRIPALYVTVDDLEGFAAALRARGIPGEDRRTRIVP